MLGHVLQGSNADGILPHRAVPTERSIAFGATRDSHHRLLLVRQIYRAREAKRNRDVTLEVLEDTV